MPQSTSSCFVASKPYLLIGVQRVCPVQQVQYPLAPPRVRHGPHKHRVLLWCIRSNQDVSISLEMPTFPSLTQSRITQLPFCTHTRARPQAHDALLCMRTARQARTLFSRMSVRRVMTRTRTLTSPACASNAPAKESSPSALVSSGLCALSEFRISAEIA